MSDQSVEHTTIGGSLTQVQAAGPYDEPRRFPNKAAVDPGRTMGISVNGSLADWLMATPQFQGLVAAAYQDIVRDSHNSLPDVTVDDEQAWELARAKIVRGLVQDLVRYI